MVCRKCRKNEATFFLSSARFDERVRIGFCDTCADEAGIFSALMKVESLLHGYGMTPPGELEIEGGTEIPVSFTEECGQCGMDLRTFEREFLLGCDQCSHIFGSMLFNFISLLSTEPTESRLKPLYEGNPPQAHAMKMQVQKLNLLIKEELEKENYPGAEKQRARMNKIEAQLDKRRPQAAIKPTKTGLARLPELDKDALAAFLDSAIIAPAPAEQWLQSKVEIRRNLAEFAFPPRMNSVQTETLSRYAATIMKSAGGGASVIEVGSLTSFERAALEIRYYARHLANEASITVRNDEPGRMTLLNDQDHFIFSYFGQEQDALKAVGRARKDLEIFEKNSDFAFSPRFGYLTSSPRNMGAATAASVLLHLPFSLALMRSEMYPPRADRAGVRFEPFCGNSFERHGFYRVSSMTPFNANEEQIATRVFDFAHYLIKEENKLRNDLTPGDVKHIEKLTQQVIGHSRLSYRLSYQDVLRLTSFLTVGSAVGVVELKKFSPGPVIPGMSSPYIMYRDGRRYTINECEKRRADLFADLVEHLTNKLLSTRAHAPKKKKDSPEQAK